MLVFSLQDVGLLLIGVASALCGLLMMTGEEVDLIIIGTVFVLQGFFLATWEARHNVARVSATRVLMFPFTTNKAIPRHHISAVTVNTSEHHLFRYVVELELDERYPTSVGRRFHTEVLLRRNAITLAERMAATLGVPVKDADLLEE